MAGAVQIKGPVPPTGRNAYRRLLLRIETDKQHSVVLYIGGKAQKMILLHRMIPGNVVIQIHFLCLQIQRLRLSGGGERLQFSAAAENAAISCTRQQIPAHRTDVEAYLCHVARVWAVSAQLSLEQLEQVSAQQGGQSLPQSRVRAPLSRFP